jgi:hypothetical protein
MSTPNSNLAASNIPPVGVELKDSSVVLVGLDARLLEFLGTCGAVHLRLFNSPLVVTCAVDSTIHKVGKHPIGKAIDLRASDLSLGWQQTFLLVLTVLCDRYKCAVFDERNLPGAAHFHVEVAG